MNLIYKLKKKNKLTSSCSIFCIFFVINYAFLLTVTALEFALSKLDKSLIYSFIRSLLTNNSFLSSSTSVNLS